MNYVRKTVREEDRNSAEQCANQNYAVGAWGAGIWKGRWSRCLPSAVRIKISSNLCLLSPFFQSSYWGAGTELKRNISTPLPSQDLPQHWQRQARTQVHFQTLRRSRYIFVGIKQAVPHALRLGDTFLWWKDVRDTSSPPYPEHVQRRCRTLPLYSLLINFAASFSLMLFCAHKIQL